MDAILALAALILSIIVHELAHGYAADSLGDPTARHAGRLTLNPLPHIDILGSLLLPALLIFTHSPLLFGWAKPVPYNPYNLRNRRFGEAFVAIAGSATNIALAILFGLLVRYGAAFGFDAAALPWRFSSGLARLEQNIRGAGALSLILFLIVFSYLFAGPFFALVLWLFGFLIGGA